MSYTCLVTSTLWENLYLIYIIYNILGEKYVDRILVFIVLSDKADDIVKSNMENGCENSIQIFIF